MRTLISRLLRAFRREDGTATIEFVLVFPFVFSLFLMSFESGMFTTRRVMLESSVDVVMRSLKMGHMGNPTHGQMKDAVCARTVVFPDCKANLVLNMHTVDMTSWDLPDDQIECRDRSEDVEVIDAENGIVFLVVAEDLVLVRFCIAVNALFPTTGLGLKLQAQEGNSGYYWISASSAFVNEPI